MLRSIRNSSQVVTLVSRLMIRASGAARVSSSSASHQMYLGATARGMGPLARSASATYSRASLRQGSKISGALVKPEFSGSDTQSTLKISLEPGSNPSTTALSLSPWHGLWRGEKATTGPLGEWTMAAWLSTQAGTSRLDREA